MDKQMRFVIAGAALGGIIGALAAVVYSRAAEVEQGEGQQSQSKLGASRIARLGLLVLGTVREILSIT